MNRISTHDEKVHVRQVMADLHLASCWSSPEGRASITYPLTGAVPMSPSDQWIVSSEDVLEMVISMGDPGVPAVSEGHTKAYF